MLSTNRLIAIMLGRLKMDIDQCIRSYEIYANDIFSHPRRFRGVPILGDRTKYGRKILERALKKVVGDFQDRDNHVWKINTLAAPLDHCRTYVELLCCRGSYSYNLLLYRGVVASWTDSSTTNGSLPYIFRSYDLPPKTSPSEQNFVSIRRSATDTTTSSIRSRGRQRTSQGNANSAGSLPIWEAARATSAAPSYFDPVHIEDKTFLDGGLGHNNPSREALSEVWAIHRQLISSEHGYSDFPSISLFISIGSGLTKTSKEPRRKFSPQVFSIISLLRSIATETESTEDMMQDFSAIGQFPYFRFNVDQGVGDLRIDEWKRPKKGGDPASSKTLQYIRYVISDSLLPLSCCSWRRKACFASHWLEKQCHAQRLPELGLADSGSVNRAETEKYLSQEEVQKDLEECARLLIIFRRLR